MLQGTDLEHIGIVPAFPQGRVGEDKAHGIVKGQKQFLLLHNQVVGRNIVALVAAPLGGAVDLVTFLIDGEKRKSSSNF